MLGNNSSPAASRENVWEKNDNLEAAVIPPQHWRSVIKDTLSFFLLNVVCVRWRLHVSVE
jgi:hypothetical protein